MLFFEKNINPLFDDDYNTEFVAVYKEYKEKKLEDPYYQLFLITSFSQKFLC